MLTASIASSAVLGVVRLWAIDRGAVWQRLTLPRLRGWQAVFVALAVQLWLVFPGIHVLHPGARAGAIWVTQVVVACVVLANVRGPWRVGMGVVVTGLALNLLAMAANGGLMPVTPETMTRSGNGRVLERLSVGEPLTGSKDIILSAEDTTLYLLSDHIVIPGKRGSFSPGDVVIALGTFLVLQSAVTAAIDGRRA